MKEIKGKLPCDDRSYNKVKVDRYEWPPVMRILEYHHSVARAWLAAGAPKNRVSLRNIKWTPEEDSFLLDHAGNMKLKDIARRLCRSYQSTRARLNKYHRLKARQNQGFVSAAELAKLYNCSYHRICDALVAGDIPGTYDSVRHAWRIDLINITPDIEKMLMSPKITHKSEPVDLGDYDQRNNFSRKIIDGKVCRVKVGV